MKLLVKIFIICLISFNFSLARVIIVDINGSGNYRKITDGINAAVAGDTVKVLPGVYEEQVALSKDIVLMGSGCENTKIVYFTASPTVTISNGKIMWFSIKNLSTGGVGVVFNGGTLTNCVVMYCTGNGVVLANGATGTIRNCVFLKNSGSGIYTQSSNSVVVYNCISAYNSNGFHNYGYSYGNINVNYSCAYGNSGHNFANTSGNVGNVTVNPQFVNINESELDLRAPGVSDLGTPDFTDPDGTRSDMGYFGGPDAPVFPVVTSILFTPLPTGGIRIQAKARANW